MERNQRMECTANEAPLLLPKPSTHEAADFPRRWPVVAVEILLPTSSTPAAACARAASSLLLIDGLDPSDCLDPRAAARGPLGRDETVADLVGRLEAEGKRVASIFLRKGEGTSSS